MSTGDFPESSSQAILVGIMLVGRLDMLAFLSRLVGALLVSELSPYWFLDW